MPTQLYDATYEKVRNTFVVILSVELDGVCARKWNTERMIIFNSIFYNVPKALIVPRKFARAYCFDFIDGIVGCLTSS